MTWRPACGGVPKAVTHGAEFPDRLVQFLCFCHQPLPVYARPPVSGKHRRDLVEREPGGAAQRDQRQSFEHAGIEQPPQAPPAD